MKLRQYFAKRTYQQWIISPKLEAKLIWQNQFKSTQKISASMPGLYRGGHKSPPKYVSCLFGVVLVRPGLFAGCQYRICTLNILHWVIAFPFRQENLLREMPASGLCQLRYNIDLEVRAFKICQPPLQISSFPGTSVPVYFLIFSRKFQCSRFQSLSFFPFFPYFYIFFNTPKKLQKPKKNSCFSSTKNYLSSRVLKHKQLLICFPD